jgi:hypothetical protein
VIERKGGWGALWLVLEMGGCTVSTDLGRDLYLGQDGAPAMGGVGKTKHTHPGNVGR